MEVEWIKLTTDMFDNPKIKKIRREEPEGNNIILLWVMLLTIAGKTNAGGLIFISESIPYTLEDLSENTKFTADALEPMLNTLSKYGMIIFNEDEFRIKNWEEYQNIQSLKRIKEQRKAINARYYRKKKTENSANSSDEKLRQNSDISLRVLLDGGEEEKNKNKKENKKEIYGSLSNIRLTEKEFEKLGKDFGEDIRDEAIEYLSTYMEEKKYQTSSHYLTIRRWVINAVKERRSKNGYMGNSKAVAESSEDDDRFYSSYSSEELDRRLAEYEAEGI